MIPKKNFLAIAFTLLFQLVWGQENYREIFSSDYDKAVRYLEEEKWIDRLVLSYGLDPNEVKAVVFPELIRYSSIRDRIEVFALESLYAQYGRTYADFSVGPFQIKPSFAENIEIDFLKSFSGSGANQLVSRASDTVQSEANRFQRLIRLKDKQSTVKYVCMFFRWMEKKYPSWPNDEAKVKFFAAAYNSDYRNSKNEIGSFITKKFFHTGLVGIKKYSYADIVWFYFQHRAGIIPSHFGN